MDAFDDLQRLRNTRNTWRPTRPAFASGGRPAFVGNVTTTAPAVNHFCLVQPVTVFGTEAEGSAGVFTIPDSAARVAVLVLGPSVPVTGDYLICRHVDYRWVAERMAPGSGSGSGSSGAGGNPSPCGCSDPPSTVEVSGFGVAAYNGTWTYYDPLGGIPYPAGYSFTDVYGQPVNIACWLSPYVPEPPDGGEVYGGIGMLTCQYVITGEPYNPCCSLPEGDYAIYSFEEYGPAGVNFGTPGLGSLFHFQECDPFLLTDSYYPGNGELNGITVSA